MEERQVTTAPLFGVLPRAALRWIGMGLVFASLACGMVVIILWLQGFGNTSMSDGMVTQEPEPIKKEFGQHRFEKLERRQLMRCGLQEVDQQARRIWGDLDEFEAEAEEWQAKFTELLLSEQGKQVGDDPWAVRYFWDQWGNRLPEASAVQSHRDNLNTLMLSVRAALEKEGTAYQPSRQLLDKISLIDTQVEEGRASYKRHRRLLDALVGLVEDEKPLDQKTLKDRVEDLDKQMILEDFAHPASPSSSSSQHDQFRSSGGKIRSDGGDTANDASLDSLYEQAKQRSDEDADYGRTTLIRDTVKPAATKNP